MIESRGIVVLLGFKKMGSKEDLEFGTGPEFFASGLETVEVMGPVVRFVLYVHKRRANGETVKVIPFTCIMPTEAVGPAIALTLRTLGPTIIVPAIGIAARALITMH